MLTGRPPFTDNDAVVVMARHIKSTPKRMSEAAPEAMIPLELEDVVMRTLAKDPKERPASAEVFAGELLAALEAHGAQTSGVRASITNAAGIRLPESMRPAPTALPRPRSSLARFPIIVFAVPLVLLATAGGVYIGMARRAQPLASSGSATVDPLVSALPNPGTPTTPANAASPTTAATANATINLDEPPTVTPESLPRAAPTVSAISSTPGGKLHGRPPPAGKPQRTRPAAGASPATSPSATPQYGIFE